MVRFHASAHCMRNVRHHIFGWLQELADSRIEYLSPALLGIISLMVLDVSGSSNLTP